MTKLPTGWTEVTINEVADIIRGVTYSKSQTMSQGDSGSVPLLRATNIEPGHLTYEDMVYIPEKVVKPNQILQLDDIILTASSGSISVVGKSAQVIKSDGETFGAFCAVIRPKDISGRFLGYWVQSPFVRDYWSSLAKGTNINNLKPSDIQGTKIPLPSLTEQHQIVEILEDHLSRLDAAMEDVKQAKAKVAQFRRSLFQAGADGTLLGRPKSAKAPEGWRKKRFSDVATIASDLRDPKSYGRLPHIAPNHIERDSGRLLEYQTVELDGVISSKHHFSPGQILYSKIRPYLNKVTLVDFEGLCSADMYPISTLEDPKWLKYYMLSPEFVKKACVTQTRTVLPKINVRELSVIEILVPPAEEQRNIGNLIDFNISILDAMMNLISNTEKKIVSLRRSLLQAAFTGKLTREVPHV